MKKPAQALSIKETPVKSGSSNSGTEITINSESADVGFEIELTSGPSANPLQNEHTDQSSQASHDNNDQGQEQISDQASDGISISILESSGNSLEIPQPEKSQIHRGTRKHATTPDYPLVVWDRQRLQSATDPLAKGLNLLLSKGVSSALFLAVGPAIDADSLPIFVGTASINPGDRVILWTGLKWDPKIAPELWNSFIRTGFLEFPPPGTMTNVMSSRNVIRAAFGIEQTEWLSLIRVGDMAACRGVLAAISPDSLQAVSSKALEMIGSQPHKK